MTSYQIKHTYDTQHVHHGFVTLTVLKENKGPRPPLSLLELWHHNLQVHKQSTSNFPGGIK